MSTVEGYFAVGRRRLALAVCCGMVLSACQAPLGPGNGARPSGGSAATVLTDDDRARLTAFSEILHGNEAGDADRVAALVGDLVSINRLAVNAPIRQGLRSPDAAIVQGIARAVGDAQPPPTHWLSPLTDAVRSAPEEAIAALSTAISRYGEPGRAALASISFDNTLPAPRRVGPVLALGSLETREAASTLVGLLDERRHELPVVITAACRSLETLTGIDHGDDAAAWLEWWRTASRQSQQDWLRNRLTRISRDLADRDMQLALSQEDIARTEQRLAEVYRRLLQALPDDEALAELPTLLQDELVVIRRLALNRIERILRDQDVPEEVRDALAGRLDDPDAGIRLMSAELLVEARLDGIADLVAMRVEDEVDPTVVSGYLRILANQPVATTLPTIRRWIRDPELAAVAAEALWRLAVNGGIPADDMPSTLAAVRATLYTTASAPLARVLAYLGNDEDVELVQPWLDDGNDELVEAVAEGLAARGRLDPLLERAGDNETIYKIVLNHLRSEPPSVETIREFVRLSPTESQHPAWAEAVAKVAGELDPERTLPAFDILDGSAFATDELRRAVLEPTATGPDTEISTPQRVAVLDRLTPILFRLGEVQLAQQLLEQTPPPDDGVDGLRAWRLEAALRVGEFDRAQELDADPVAWIAVLEELVDTASAAASAVRDEIMTRFAEQLVGDLKTRFDAVSENVADDDPQSTATADGTS